MARRLPLLLTCALLAGAAQAAELGEPRVSSFIGQPLVADIELTMLEDAATPVGVRLAHANVYRGANIGMPAVLSTLRMSVMRRDGRQFLHVTSLGPVESEHLHLYLELADGSQRTVRLATLWLSPDPQPAPAPAPVPVPMALPAVAKAPEPAPVPKKEPVVAAAMPKPAPVPVKPKPVPRKVAETAPKNIDAVPAGGACAPQAQPQVDACVVLGAKNALLREKLDQIEGKVKLLQAAAGTTPAAINPPKVHKPKIRKAKPEPMPEAGPPWLLVGAGAGVLALLAGLAVFLRRRKPRQRVAEPRVGLGARLKQRLGRKPTQNATVEPSLEERAHESSTQV